MPRNMQALVYEGPYQMNLREVETPSPQDDEVLIRVAYSGICGSELSGFEGKNALRKPPLIMGHEFSGWIEAIGDEARARFPALQEGAAVTANPLITCGDCVYCQSGREELCVSRKLLSAALPGSNAQYVTIRADALHPLPDGVPLTTAALAEPAACALHTVRIGLDSHVESALVVGAGPIGLLTIQALRNAGAKTVYCGELNPRRLAMAEALGAVPVDLTDAGAVQLADVAVDAVGTTATRQACLRSVRSGGRVIWVGLHQAESALDINDMIRREITSIGSFGYSPVDFAGAVRGLAEGWLSLSDEWTRVEPLARGTACFEELLKGSPVAKIWLSPWETGAAESGG